MTDDIVVDIKFRGDAPQFLAELSRQVGRAKQQLQEMGQSAAALSRLETQLARMATTAGTAATATARAAQATQGWAQRWTPFKGQFQAAEDASKRLWTSIDQGFAASDRSIGRATASLAKFDEAQRQASRADAKQAPMDAWDKQFAAATVAADRNTEAMKRAKRAVDEYQNSLSNTRYVLYDVAGTLSILGVGLVTPIAAAVGVAAKFELAFAQVARTSGVAGAELEALKEEFDSLYSSLPVTYEGLAQIATLAGQLGVPAKDIANFTETVAKTATVTDLSVDAAATAFGRLNALIPNVRGQYDRLGSAIAKVGVNSVATESEIVNISTQISSMGSFAGLTAQDIIGLSGALASIGAQPELSRGTVTRVFTLMSKAVAEGGESLDQFARLSGVSATQFASSWGTPAFTDTFLGFMRGIQAEGGNAVAALNELGITSVRDVPLLLRLANAADSTGKAGALLAQTIGDANQGWAENIELQRQYEVIAGTLAKRVEVLANNFNLLLQAIGAPMLQGLGDFVVLLTEVVKWTTDVAKSDLGGSFLRVLTVIAALGGVLAIAAASMALFGAASIGIYQGLQFIAATSPRAAAALVGVSGAAGLANGSLKAGAASALLFGRALKAITIVGALLILPEILKGIGGWLDEIAGRDVSKPIQTMKELATSSDMLFASWRSGSGITRNFGADFANSLTAAGRSAVGFDDSMKELIASGSIDRVLRHLNEFNRYATDVDASGTLDLFSSVVDSADEAGFKLEVVGDEIVNVGKKGTEGAAGTQEVSSAMEVAAEAADQAKGALEEYKAALDAINGTQISAAEASDRLQSSINSAWEALAAGDVTLEGTNSNSIAFRDSLREIEASARTAGEAILENGGDTEEAMAKWQAGRSEIENMLVQMGHHPDKARAMADAMFGTAEQMQSAFRAISSGLAAVPASKTITLVADTNQAQERINRLIYDNNGRKVTINVEASGNLSYGVHGQGMRRQATGGAIWGPGTATSDSIPALLSNGEFVIRTAAARAMGYARLDYMNRTGKLPAFANGGGVGVSAPSLSMPGVMVVELSARDRVLLERAGNVNLSIDGKVIAQAGNHANFVSAQRGTN